MVRVAVAQLCSTVDIEGNFAKCAMLIAKAAQAGCAMICLPENFDWVFPRTRAAEAAANTETLEGPMIRKYSQMAVQHNIWLSLGGFHERVTPPLGSDASGAGVNGTGAGAGANGTGSVNGTADGKIMRNTHVIISNTGHTVASYSKIHLFDAAVPGGPVFTESATVQAGSRPICVRNTPLGCLGLTVCYDLRFPMLYSALRYMGLSDVLLVPSAFPPQTGAAHWETMLRARAIETQCYVIAAAQAGAHSDTRVSYGHSMVVDPWGRVLCEMDSEQMDIAVADIDHAVIKRVRDAMPFSQHVRTDIFGSFADVDIVDAATTVAAPVQATAVPVEATAATAATAKVPIPAMLYVERD